jgi:DNA-binding NarL/FixJ family response regulator
MSRLRIFLADDHALLRDGLKALVNCQPDMEIVGEADNGRVACDKVKVLLPDIVLMDISMPELNGMQATKKLKEICPAVRILVLSAYEDKGYFQHAMEAGASGFLLKRAATEELIQAIRVIAGNGSYIDPTMAGKMLAGYIVQTSNKKLSSNQLSDREAEVLRLMAWGYSNKEIAAQLDICVKTVETYKARLAEKLDLRSRTAIVRYAIRQGWLQEV